MSARHSSFLRGRRGANAMEFAMVSTFVLVPLVLVTLEMSWYLGVRIGVEHCLRDAGRAGADTCDPGHCSFATGGECQFCITEGDPEDVAEQRFEDCWTDMGYPGTPTGAAVLVAGSTSGHTKLRVTGSVTYTSLAASTALPNPVTSEAYFRMDDQGFEP